MINFGTVSGLISSALTPNVRFNLDAVSARERFLTRIIATLAKTDQANGNIECFRVLATLTKYTGRQAFSPFELTSGVGGVIFDAVVTGSVANFDFGPVGLSIPAGSDLTVIVGSPADADNTYPAFDSVNAFLTITGRDPGLDDPWAKGLR